MFLTAGWLVVMALGVVGLRYGREVFIDRCRLGVQPTDDLRAAQGAIACADATFERRRPGMRVAAGTLSRVGYAAAGGAA